MMRGDFNDLTNFRFERLEPRRLLAVAMSGTQLFITGTDAGDHVLITMNARESSELRVNVNGEWMTFDRNEVSGIEVNGGSGRDHLIVAESGGNVTIPVTLIGGGGPDLLIGGSAGDHLMGGPGRDRVIGMGGNDLINGGSSRDLLAGGDGADTIIGGRGDDAIEGDGGHDVITGNGGDDHVSGDAGDDLIIGGADSDEMFGGFGEDSISGGRGEDDIDGGIGADEITGGGGDDAFAKDETETDNLTDKTDGADREYTPVSMDFVPKEYHDLFIATFPHSEPIGVRINDDQTFVMLYRYNGDGSTYHAYFTFTGDSPFDDLDGVDLITYEVAPANLPPLTNAHFREQYPDAIVKEVFADRDEHGKFARIRIQDGSGDTHWIVTDWLDGDPDDGEDAPE